MIVVSILAPDLATLRVRALAQLPFADAIELRLDDLAHATESDLRELIRALGKPVIAAVNGPDAFGTFNGTRAKRFALLTRAARAGAAFVDVDWKEAPHQDPIPPSCRRIVSRHILEGTPADLASQFQELETAACAGDLPKFITHAKSGEDGIRLLEFSRTLARDHIAFASGERGSFTRILAPIFGSTFTYAAPARSQLPANSAVQLAEVGRATAPGQLRADEVRSHWGSRSPTRTTEIYAVLGLPARHSLSPRLHNAVFRATDRDAVYVAIEPDDIAAFMRSLRAPNWRGFSITAPFKEAAFALADTSDELSSLCRATNTLLCAQGRITAVNTDVGAIEHVVAQALTTAKIDAAGARLLVVGSGGAARAAIVALRRARGSSVFVTARNDAKAAQLAHEFGVQSLPRGAPTAAPFDLIVHCTPAGSRAAPNEIAVPLALVRSARAVVEAVYRPALTPLVEAAEAAGAAVTLGQSWFLHQAVLQSVCFGENAAEATRVMRPELEHALADERS